MIYLDVCCNDPDNGNFAGRAAELQIGEAEFESKYFDAAPAFKDLGASIRLAGKSWSVGFSKDWVGNWCWNRYLLVKPGAGITHRWYLVEFVTWLRKRKLFDCTSAPADFHLWFDGDTEIASTEVHRLVMELER